MALFSKGKDPNSLNFLEHLDALRWHLFRTAIAVLGLTILAFMSKDFIFGTLIMGPKRPDFITFRWLCSVAERWSLPDGICVTEIPMILINTEMAGQFTRHITLSFSVGLMMGFPYMIWELWRFAKPGLLASEIRKIRGVVLYSSILFITGVCIAYFVVCPMSIQFLASYSLSADIANQITLGSYMSTVLTICFTGGLIFQLPILIWILATTGIVSAEFLRKYRRHALVVILILAAFLSPTPDIPTQLLISMPLFFLYELSIFIAARTQKNKEE